MKALLPLVVLCLACAALPAQAAPGKKKGGGPAPAPAPASKTQSPGAALQPYIDHLDGLLALQPPPPKAPFAPMYRQAESKLTVLRQQFVTDGQSAPEDQKDRYRAAIATVDSLNGAIAERRQTAANLESSRQMTGSAKLEQGPRKDNLSQGVKGGELPKAVAEIEEGKRERAANRAAKEAAANKDNSMTAMAVNRWKQRCIQLRQGIMANYAKAQ
jgi:hypothetical protein